MTKDIEKLKIEVEKIKERNRKVELDKAWEISWIRKIVIVVLTYIVIVIFFYFAKLPNPLVNSIVPSLAFIISTLTLSLFKKVWLKSKTKS